MPLIDLNEPMKISAAGGILFATDTHKLKRVAISVPRPVFAYYRGGAPTMDSAEFRAFLLGVASGLYEEGPKDGYVIVDMEALDLPA